MSIVVGSAASIPLSLKVAGVNTPIPNSATVSACLVAAGIVVTPIVTADPHAIGANWAAGVVVVEFTALETANLTPGAMLLQVIALNGLDTQRWNVPVSVTLSATQTTALFSRDLDVPLFRNNRLAGVASLINVDALSDDYLWELMVEAESDMQRDLGVFLQPTALFPVKPPTTDQLAAIGNKPWRVEPGYDCPPNFFSVAQWGSTQLRQKLLISVEDVRVVYPTETGPSFTIPPSWVLIDPRGSILQIVPGASGTLSAPLSVFMMQALSAGYSVPHMLRVQYTAGLTPDHELFPAVRGLALRSAAVRLLLNSYIPQSGSVSADGLSQSNSMDVSKFQDAIEAEVASLRERLCGPVWAML